MKENKNLVSRKTVAIFVAIMVFVVLPATLVLAGNWLAEKTAEMEANGPNETFEFTIGPVDGLPRCALVKTPDDTFITVQADDKINIDPRGNVCTVTDVTRNYDYMSYTTGLDKVLIFQVVSGTVLETMENRYGPAQVTCDSPDGKTISGRAEKIYVHKNGACEFIIGNTWYCTDVSNLCIMSSSHDVNVA